MQIPAKVMYIYIAYTNKIIDNIYIYVYIYISLGIAVFQWECLVSGIHMITLDPSEYQNLQVEASISLLTCFDSHKQ